MSVDAKRSPTGLKKSTNRKNAESDALFLSIGEGAIMTDERGNISRVNGAALRILRFELKDMLGKWYPSVIIAEDNEGNAIPVSERPAGQVFITGKTIFRKLFFRRKDGTRVPVALTISPVMLDGQPIGAIEVFRDITEEVELENAKDEFISIASHQLRTPATVVKQYLGMMLGGFIGDLTKAQKDALKTAYDYNENQLDTINDLLKIAQADANKIALVRKEIDFVKLVQDVAGSQQKNYAKAKLNLVVVTDDKDARAIVDPLHIRMVLENLLDNARKYSQEKSQKVTVKLHTTPSHITVSVIDEGIGIDSKDLAKLFQKFSRVNSFSGASGTGLGLYWAKKLIDLHKGSITVTSKLGQGTTFTVKVPRSLHV